ncbi:slipin family protein [Aminiphilus circumscriptus]|jgi:regulator of protease activity HflC (stomatin/prohibitin superfamily)|uniref:slipin family protein n=1 Tax=Aminiphilus circumscriptus TaxID=290732 RepID=UPI000492DDA9|nr:slipin family protein [Aminiphilus circumscriptus]
MIREILEMLIGAGSSLGGLFILVILFVSAVKVVPEYQRAVVFRLGRLIAAKGPGLVLVIPFVDRVLRVDLRVVTLDVPVQEVITRDNVPIKVNAVVYFRVMDPSRSMVEVENYIMATSQLSQTTLRSVIGRAELDEVLSARDKINQELQQIIDERTDPWGIKVSAVEVKELELPEGMKRAMARQAEAERERRAKVINAEGEFQAAERLTEAAHLMEKSPVTLQLRYLQTLREVASEKNSTTIFPLPIDLVKPFLERHLFSEAKEQETRASGEGH